MKLKRSILLCALVVSVLMALTGSCVQAGTGHSAPVLTLSEAISIALEKNPDILSLAKVVSASRESAKAAWADRWAKISTGYTYTHLRDEPYVTFRGIPGASELPVGKRHDARWYAAVTQPLFTGFALSTREELARIGVDVAGLQKEIHIHDVKRDVKHAYFNVLLAQRSLEVAREAVEQLDSHLRDARNFYKQGLIPYNDLLRSQVALAAARQEEVRALSQVEATKAALNILLDRDVNAPVELEDVPEALSCAFDLNELLAIAKQKRPELKALALRLKQAELKVRLAKSKYYPRLSLTGRYEQHGDDLSATRNEFGNSNNAMVGIEVSWTPFEWGKTTHKVRSARHEQDAIRYRLKGMTDKVALQVKRAWLNLNVAKKNIETAKTALAQARENYRLTNLRYREQVTTSTEVLDARTFLTEAEMNYHGAVYGYYLSLAGLERAVGSALYPLTAEEEPAGQDPACGESQVSEAGKMNNTSGADNE